MLMKFMTKKNVCMIAFVIQIIFVTIVFYTSNINENDLALRIYSTLFVFSSAILALLRKHHDEVSGRIVKDILIILVLFHITLCIYIY